MFFHTLANEVKWTRSWCTGYFVSVCCSYSVNTLRKGMDSIILPWVNIWAE